MHRLIAIALVFAIIGIGYSIFSNNSVIPSPETWSQSHQDDVQPTEIQVAFPENLSYQFISTSKWPPSITPVNPLACNDSSDSLVTSELVLIDGIEFCKSVSEEGAAGSVYRTYNYSGKINKEVQTISFTLQVMQCQNYDDFEASQCADEQASFNPDQLMADAINR